jgi:cytochrome P450
MSVDQFTFADPATLQCPFDYYEAMREEEPVHFDAKIGMFIVTRYNDIVDVVKQPRLFSSTEGFEEQLRQDYTPEIERMMVEDGLGPLPLAVYDPPEHTRIRALMDKAFTPQRVATMEGYVHGVVSDLIDAFIEKGEAELINEFAIPIPMYVIADQLGFSRADRDIFKRWSDSSVEPLSGVITKERAFECARDMIDLQKYLKQRIDERRAEPKDDMITDLVHARLTDEETGDDMPTLSETELYSVVRGLLVAGNETTTNAIANAVLLMIRNPDKAAALRQELDRERSFVNLVEEVLRIESPVPNLFRMTTADTEIGGVPIPKGSHILLAWASANRDENKFECPAQFDPARKNAGHHLAFGAGIHRCIGQALARMEVKVAIREVLSRMDDLELAIPESELRYTPNITTRGLVELPIRFKKRG